MALNVEFSYFNSI